ncbi:hypothetical protein IE53DRAFT_54518 [Violaceomyces palustris]|uniref:Uncharacterized protein n=1 Tax=Violaceomyces palustris TaxID=1673888 RepID=A0ACD0NZQ3_9BASI|nr:hypothetical protein IE53DRAFT_54518 [Violaceomyces palustris]
MSFAATLPCLLRCFGNRVRSHAHDHSMQLLAKISSPFVRSLSFFFPGSPNLTAIFWRMPIEHHLAFRSFLLFNSPKEECFPSLIIGRQVTLDMSSVDKREGGRMPIGGQGGHDGISIQSTGGSPVYP